MAKRKLAIGDDAKEGKCTAKEDGEYSEDHPVWSKSKKKRMRRNQAKNSLNNNQETNGQSVKRQGDRSKNDESGDGKGDESANEARKLDAKKNKEKPAIATNVISKSSSLIEAFKARLSGSRFRTLNEELYTMTSRDSFQRFSQNPELFHEYHSGYRHQVNSWPVNPLNVIVEKLKAQAATRREKLVVADFGCGEAQLAQELLKVLQPGRPENTKKRRKGAIGESANQEEEHLVCPFKVHSFDLVQPQDEETRHLVSPCDMANVPLGNSSVDVGVFCLSLMGTNLADFVREAHRVVKPDGCVWIAEVRSRFAEDNSAKIQSPKHRQQHASNSSKPSTPNDNLQKFILVLEDLGFRCTQKDLSNKMFFLLQLEKTGNKPKRDLNYTAKACIYKRR